MRVPPYVYILCVLVAVVWRTEALVLVALVAAGAWLGPIIKARTTQRYIHGGKSGLWKEYEKMVYEKPVFSGRMFYIHKGPRSIKYILMHDDARGLVEDLDFIRKYNPEILANIIIYLEHFFKVHYNVMIEKYDPCTYTHILQDLVKQCISTVSSAAFSLPKVSTIIDIPDIDEYMEKKTRQLQAIMESYMEVLKHKYRDRCPNAFGYTSASEGAGVEAAMSRYM